jgi:hypothetical protein
MPDFAELEVDPTEPIAPPPVLPASNVTRKNKWSKPANEDPEILARLSRVAAMILKGVPAYKMAESEKMSVATAQRDISRVKAIWRRQANEKLGNLRDAAIAEYKLVIAQCWELAEKYPERADRFFTQVVSAQARIDKVTGIEAPEKVDVTGEVKVRNIEAVRQKRWEQIKNQLAELEQVQEKTA